RCRKPCDGGLWVGQTVFVRGADGTRAARTATISDCDIVPVSPSSSSGIVQAGPAPARAVRSGIAANAVGSGDGRSMRRIWVRYDSGLEEQVGVGRIVIDAVDRGQRGKKGS
ncbi:MAG: hypothetical protein FWD57_08865, partial [Polyangiaceae bacterium]|nr:hypothetical protein [Polyangiaceae bacterium]